MSHDHHDHSQAWQRAGQRHSGALRAAFGLTALILVVEFVAALATGSLALLSDAGHMLTDVGGLGMALAAIHLATRGRGRDERSFGLYRLEILAALANAVLLFGVAAYVLFEAIQRIGDEPELATNVVLLAAGVGFAANLVSFRLLRAGAKQSVNVEGAYLEVLADLVGSVAVLASAAVIAVTGWQWVDPLAGAALGLWILPRTLRLARKALRVLLQVAPASIDLAAVHADLAALPDVVDVHDLHVWTLTSEMDVATAHLMIKTDADGHAVLDRARALLAQRYHLEHATLQVEPEDHTGCDEVSW
ncbi:MAG TPA: cation diffusion facilitator family transporter [Acidimicrobiales bacterium]|nr:cation diffusion facilitator family transporter [Acidimicrobiales bacterium]